jgi:ankyrin repeat protein
MVAFTNLLNRIPLPWLTESLSVCDNCTPIPYFLIHLWLRSGDSDPPDHLQSIIERGGSQTNLLKDKLGNTILHIVARYSPNVLFLEALKNDWLDFKVTNELGETPILVYVKSVSVESPIIPRVIEKYQNHPSVKIANKFDPFTLLAMDSKGRNCFMVTLFREFLRKDPFGSESLLASNILSLIPLLDEKSASELIHFLLSSFPQISVTDVVGRDALETLDEKRWLQMIKKLDSTGVPLNVVMNGATAFDKIVNQAKIEDKWQQLVADARDSLKMKTMVEVHPEILIVNQVYSTPLHQICANPNSAIIGLVKSYPELILVADAMNRLPIHLFLQNVRERDQSSLTMLSAIVGGNTGVFKLKDQFYMTPLMYSIMGDCCFNYTSQDSTVTQYLLQQPDASEHECPETPSQRNAAFLLLQNIIGYGKNEFLPAEGKMYLTPHTVVDIITRWKEHCNLDLELIDEDGGTIVDYWEQHITENNLPLGVNAVLKGGLGNLGAQTAEELFEENQMMEIDAVEEVATETVVQLDVKRGFVEPEEDVWIPPNHVKLAVPEVKKPVEPLDNKKIQEGIIGWRAMQFFERTQGGSEISKQDRNLSPEPLVDIIDEPVSIPLDVQGIHYSRRKFESSKTDRCFTYPHS